MLAGFGVTLLTLFGAALAISELGNICNPVIPSKPYVGDKSQYYKCVPDQSGLWNISVGQWQLTRCPNGEEFIEQLQGCKNPNKFRKMQTACAQNPQLGGCMQQQPCTASNANPSMGSPCSWMTAPLTPAPQPSGFLQCVPPTSGASCGQWQPMPCQSGTTFNVQLQICVSAQAQAQNTCGQQAAPVCGCAAAQPQPIPTMPPMPVPSSCPGTTSCNMGTCCQQLQVPQVPVMPPMQPYPQPIPQPMPQPIIPTCPGIGVQPVSSCQQGCGVGFQCQSGGCCPLPTCPQTGMQAISGCSSGCPQGYGCFSGGCCQQQPMPTMPMPTLPPMPTCQSTGQPAIMTCAGSCPMGYGCQSGGCCPQPLPTCWNGVPAIGVCNGPVGCPVGYSCQNGGCCQQQLATCPSTGQVAQQACSGGCPAQQSCFAGACCPPIQQPVLPPAPVQPVTIQISITLPICPGNVPSTTPCSGSCQAGYQCYQGGCCPTPQPIPQPVMPLPYIQQPALPTCPTGVIAPSPCSGSCSSGFSCYQGGCCPQPMPTCPGGQPATSTCDRGCGAGSSCFNGGCCRLQTCPGTGALAPGFCNSGCPQQNSCVQGSCCPPPLPQCPNGQQASAMCQGVGQCPMGQSCQNGGCCALPACPTGQMPAQECGVGGICPTGFACQLGGCCPVPMCPNGQVAVQTCGVNGMCPSGFTCQGGSCCPQPIPSCPNGAPAVQQCSGANCPDGYGCARGNACCLLAAAPSCGVQQQPVCQCATNNMCPGGTGCNQGTCCASAATSVFASQFPGAPCQQSTQCTGYSSGSSQCQSGYCQCSSGCWSNGITCQPQAQQPQVYSPRSSCGTQFNVPCKLRFSAAKRKPVLEADITNKTEPIFFRPLENVTRVCLKDNTCLPNEFCLDKKCHERLYPGQYGCERDEQCNYDCESSYCDKTPKNKFLWQCKCRNSFIFGEVGLCFKKCPDGTETKGNRCRPVRESSEFWSNPELHKTLLSTHTCGEERVRKL